MYYEAPRSYKSSCVAYDTLIRYVKLPNKPVSTYTGEFVTSHMITNSNNCVVGIKIISYKNGVLGEETVVNEDFITKYVQKAMSQIYIILENLTTIVDDLTVPETVKIVCRKECKNVSKDMEILKKYFEI